MSNDLRRIAILSVHSSPLGKPGARDTGGMSIYIRELAREMAAGASTGYIHPSARFQQP